jgi:hypothetical protein
LAFSVWPRDGEPEVIPIETHRTAQNLVQDLRDKFNEIVLPAILADRVDELSEQTEKDIAADRKIDLRVPRFLSVSGKGGPGFDEWSNVTLFDHASSVAMAASIFAAVDLLGGGHASDEARSAAAVAFAVGLLHDIDKLLVVSWDAVTLEHVREIFERYRIGAFLDGFGVDLTAEMFGVLISFDEARSAYRLAGARPRDRWINIVRRHVRLADVLDSLWLRGLPINTVDNVLKEWERAISTDARLYNPSAFADYKKLLVSDPHHPFLLAKFADSLDSQCELITGMRPLLHAVRDETLVSLLPASEYDEVVSAAIEETLDALPFESDLIISPAGLPKIGGAKPSWPVLRRIVEQKTPTGETRRLLSVKVADFQLHETALRNLAVQAGCPFVPTDKQSAGQTMPIIRSVQRGDPEFAAVERACLISLAVGVEEENKAKEFSRKAREQRLASLLQDGAPGWVEAVDPLTRRTALALIATARMNQNIDLASQVEAEFAAWFAEDGVFRGRPDRGSLIRGAVRNRLMTLASCRSVELPEAAQSCLVTAEPVNGEPIESTDGLYGVNSSALSYRPGRAEHKFREIAETYLSPVSQAEYRLRSVAFAKLARNDGGLAVRLSSPTAGGIFSLAIGRMHDRGEFGLYDMVRSSTAKLVYHGLEAYQSRTHLGRFESLPKHFADRGDGKGVTPGRISFFRVAMEAAQRYGRPLHLFSGLPHARREFFYCDCLDPELRELLGGDGLRLEALPEAMRKLKIVGQIAGPQKNDGLGMADVAKSFCRPATRFTAACLAWVRTRDRARHANGKEASGQLQADLNRYIEQKVKEMDKENAVSPPVTLGRMAASIQRRPGYDASARDETFLIDMAVEGATYAYRNGWRDREGLIAQVAGRINVDGSRRADGVKGFYSAKANREAGQNIADAIQTFAEAFVDLAWLRAFKGRPPSSNDLRNFLAAYRWTFARSAPKDPAESRNATTVSN